MIEILRAGRLNSVQDLGRHGFRHMGVCQSGALDSTALSVANRLVGNPCNAAGLEFTFGPCILRFTADTRIALTGADFDATLDQRPVSPWWSVPVRAGQSIQLQGPRTGMRAYLAVAGGIDVEVQLGARATDLQAGFGGHAGRALRDGDRLAIDSSVRSSGQNAAAIRTAPAFGIRPPDWYQGGNTETISVRVIPGPEYAQFSSAAQKTFWNSGWTLTPHSNRMGFRLAGPELKINKNKDLPSHGVVPGVIQVPPAGQPIVLMAEAQTTGGYPKIGVVIQADLPRLAQLRINRTLQFVICDRAQALTALQENARFLQLLDNAMRWLQAAKK